MCYNGVKLSENLKTIRKKGCAFGLAQDVLSQEFPRSWSLEKGNWRRKAPRWLMPEFFDCAADMSTIWSLLRVWIRHKEEQSEGHHSRIEAGKHVSMVEAGKHVSAVQRGPRFGRSFCLTKFMAFPMRVGFLFFPMCRSSFERNLRDQDFDRIRVDSRLPLTKEIVLSVLVFHGFSMCKSPIVLRNDSFWMTIWERTIANGSHRDICIRYSIPMSRLCVLAQLSARVWHWSEGST
jgi:hypothetical protein